MYQRILVPLDGTTHAERALPVAARIARASGASMVLLQVADAPVEYGALSKYPSPITKENLAVERTGDSGYLATVAESDELQGIEITTEVLAGAILPTLISAVQAKGIDLIVMCSHGDTGLKRWMLGSVAWESILRAAAGHAVADSPPVLRPPATPPTDASVEGKESSRMRNSASIGASARLGSTADTPARVR